MKKLTLIFAFFSLPFFGFSQNLEVQRADQPPINPEVLANLFPGQGVQIIDWSYGGVELAAGVFTDGTSTIGIDHGIILTSGDAALAPEANNSQSDGISNLTIGDVDLDSLSGVQTFDANSLTIVFKPISETMNFKYAFASDEYIEYVNSSFNDAFGFFVSGPGINGPYSNNAINIAQIPGTSDPVAINTVNHLTNTQFFNENLSPITGGPSGVPPTYDGYTDVLSATLPVVPLEEYTLKIVVADAGDGIFDSAVFLEAESLSGGNDSLVASVSNSFYNPCIEGEEPSLIMFDLSGFGPWTFPFQTTVGGTAERGVDFELEGLPQSIPATQPMLNVDVEIFQDSEIEGVEHFTIEFESQGGFVFPYHFYISDGIAVPLEDLTLCEGPEAVTLSVQGPTPGEAFEFSNENTDAISQVNVAYIKTIEVTDVPVEVLTNVSLIESVCLNIDHNFLEDLDIHLISPNGQVLKLSTDNGGQCNDYSNTCFSPAANQRIDEALVGGCGPGGEAPSSGSFLPEGDWDIFVDTPVNGTWKLAIVDDNSGFVGTFQDWDITFNTQLIFEDPIYEWSTGENTPYIEVMPTTTTTYSVTVTQAGQTLEDEATIFIGGENSTSEIASSHCENEAYSITVNGTVYDMGNPSGTEVFPNASYLGCDSTVNINLTFFENTSENISAFACQGDCLTFGGQTICESGIYDINLTNFQGCDSTLTVDFTKVETEAIIPPPATLDPIQPSSVLLDGSASWATPVTGSSFEYSWSGTGIVGPSDGETVTVNSPGTYCLTVSFSVNSILCENTSCVEVIEGQLLDPNPPLLDGATLVCNEALVYTATDPDGMAVTFNWTTPNGEPFTVTSPNSIEVDWTGSVGGSLCVTSTNPSGTSAATCLEVEVIPEISVQNLSVETSCDLQFYTVSFEIVGGDPTSYFVQPFGSGTLAGNVFTSDPIPCGNGYLFIVSDDSGCSEITVSENEIACECASLAGLMNINPLVICGPGEVTANYPGSSQFLDCDDVLNFLLYQGNPSFPIELSPNPTFDLSGLNPGQSYFISAVVGNDDGTGLVDMNDPCLDFSAGVVARYELPPTANFSVENIEACEGEQVILEGELTGEEPWTLTYETDGSQVVMDEISEPTFEIPFSVDENSNIVITNLADDNCSSEFQDSLTIEALPSPNPEITSTSPVCPNTSDAIQIEFDGAAPYYVAYTLNGTLFFDSVPGDMLAFGANIGEEDVEFVLVSTTGANGCSSGQSETVNISVIPPPVGSANFNGPLCPGFDLELMAEGGVNFEWSGPNGFASDDQMLTIEDITEDNIGDYTVNVINECDDVDMVTLPIEFVCSLFEYFVFVGETGEICFDEIISSADLCDPVSAISVELNGNCLSFTGLSVGNETICLQVVLDGMEIAVTIEVTSLMPTSASELEATPSLNIYPNPASETLLVSWKNTQVEQVEILDLTGRRMNILPTADNPFEVPLLDLPEGSYLLRCHTTDGILVEKFVILVK